MTDDLEQHANQLIAQMTGRILDEGFVVQFIPADLTSVIHGGQPYAYTVGRTLVGRPEWLVTGIAQEDVGQLLGALVNLDDSRMRHPAGAATADQMSGTFVTVNGVTHKLVRANEGVLMGAQAAFGPGRIVAVQALWPEVDGTYPDDHPNPNQPIHRHGVTPLVENDPYA